jgi:hypothetical protein
MEIDVRIRWSHLDTDEEHFVIERVPLPRDADQRERQLREMTLRHHSDACQRLYNHEKGHAAFNNSRWLIVTKYEWGTEGPLAPQPDQAASQSVVSEGSPL